MWKKLIPFIGRNRKNTLLSPFFVTLEVGLDVLIPFLMAKLIDEGIDKGNFPTIIQIGSVLFIATLFNMFFGVMVGRYAAKASAGYAKNLRQAIFYKIQDFSFENIDHFSTPSLVTRLTTDVSNIQNAFQVIIRVAVRSPILLVFSFFMAFTVNRQLSMIFLFLIPFLGIGLYVVIQNAHPIFEKVFAIYDTLNRVVEENVRGIRVVKSFVREEFEIQKFKKVSYQIFSQFTKAESIVSFVSPLMQTTMYASILLIAWFGSRLIIHDSMTTGQLMSFITYAMQMLMSLMMLTMVFVMIIISRASVERTVAILDELINLKNPENPILAVPDGSINFSDVNFSYSHDTNRLSLASVSFAIQSGETIGIVGSTGSSKSTLVQLIPRLFDATSGTVSVGGTDVRLYDINALRDAVSIVLQKNELFSGSIKDNLRWGNDKATDEELIHACKLAQAHAFIMGFAKGYDTHIEQDGTNVSGGQKQRLCIARSLVKKPKILILDDATSAVDTKTEKKIQEAFKKELPDTTILIIGERISSVSFADRIIVLNNGTVDAIGTHETLLKQNAIYKEMYESQAKKP